MPRQDKTCILIDANSLLYRAFFAIPHLSTSDGQPTNALFGFAGMLLKIIEQYTPAFCIAAFDAPVKTFRHEEFADYKGTRKPTPDELKAQAGPARELAESLGILVLEEPGFEADDVVGACAVRAAAEGYRVIIFTGDMDELQLVNDQVSVASTSKGVSELVLYTPEKVYERYGLSPSQFVDYKALKGDASDNIPGVPGVGDKTASKLISEFGSIDNLLENLDALPEGRIKKAIADNRDQLLMSRRLATIVTDIPLDLDFDALKNRNRAPGEAESLFRRLQFENLAKRLNAVLPAGQQILDDGQGGRKFPEVKDVSSASDWSTLLASIEKDPAFALSLQMDGPEVTGAGFSSGQDAWAVRIGSTDDNQQSLLLDDGKFELPLRQLADLALKYENKLICHDHKRAVLALGLAEKADKPARDTMLEAFLLQPGRGTYPEDWLASRYLDMDMPQTGSTQEAALRAWVAANSAPLLLAGLQRESLETVYRDIELPLSPVLARMQHIGVKLDVDYLAEFSERLARDLADLEMRIYAIAGEEFTIGSPKQLGEVLFNRLGLPSGKKTKTGYSTSAEVLEWLAADYEIAALVLEWREGSKLKSTYADALPRLVNPHTGRLHTTFNQTGAATGRLSSSDPNLQNIPIKTELGRMIRAAFVSEEGKTLVSADYSQIELRLLAHLSEDDELVRCFREEEDIHTRTASALFGVPVGEVTPEQRRRGKTINFSVIYGKTDFGLSKELGIGVAEAREYIDTYFRQYPGVRALTEKILEQARQAGYVSTIFGRKRWLPELSARDHNVRSNAERAAFNAPLQGSAADIIKLAMISLGRSLAGHPARMLLQVHDELVFEVDEGAEQELAALVRREMEGVCRLHVPLVADVKCGKNWRDMQPLARVG